MRSLPPRPTTTSLPGVPASVSLPGVPVMVGILPLQSSGGTLTGAVAVAVAAPRRLAVWPVNTVAVDVPFDDVAVTLTV